MKHMLMNPAFPDIVGEYAFAEVTETEMTLGVCANDNGDMIDREVADPLFDLMARQEIAASRLW
jgi:hypothetical protein